MTYVDIVISFVELIHYRESSSAKTLQTTLFSAS